MRIKVVFATRNGARTLPAALAGHLSQRLRPEQVVAVDNGSTDRTGEILHGASDNPGLRLTVLREGGRGKNRALNRALPLVSDADLVVFTDDDAVPEPDWLEQLAAAAQSAPRHAILGGTIKPGWMAPPPAWLFDWRVPLDVCFAVNASIAEGPVAAKKIWGPNMAVRGGVLRQGHSFDVSVGPDGSPTYPMGSETEFTQRLERAGHHGWFARKAVVRHLVRPEQMEEHWVIGRAYRCGLGAARIEPSYRDWMRDGGLPAGLAGRRLAYGGAAAAARRLLPPGRLRFWLEWQDSLVRGLCDGLAAAQPAHVPASVTTGLQH
jgi:hypothetical protein